MGYKDYGQKVEAFIRGLDVDREEIEDDAGDDVKHKEQEGSLAGSNLKKNKKKSKREKIKKKEEGLSEKELADEQEMLIQAAAARMMANVGSM